MYKCENCGQEFDSNFCPKCGQKRQEDKICPDCGALLKSTVRFCPDCGHSFIAPVIERKNEEVKKEIAITQEKTAEPVQAVQVTKAVKEKRTVSADTVVKICSYLKYAPSAIFALFSVLLFAFFAGAVAVIPGGDFMGEKIPSENLGNLYNAYSGKSLELAEVRPAATMLIITAVFSLIIALAAVAVQFIPFTKYKRVNLFGSRVRLYNSLAGSSFLFYFLAFVVGCATCGKIASLDGGEDMLKAGACPVLLIVFSLLFALLTVGAFVARKILGKKFPAAFEAEKAEMQKYSSEMAARKANIVAPCPPQKVEEVEKPAPPVFAKKIIKARRTTGLFAIAFSPMVSFWVFAAYTNPSVVMIICVGILIATILLGTLTPINRLSLVKPKSCIWVYNKDILTAAAVFIFLSIVGACIYPILQTLEFQGGWNDSWKFGEMDSWDYGNYYEEKEYLIWGYVIFALQFGFALSMFIYGLVGIRRIKVSKNSVECSLLLNDYFNNLNLYKNYKKQFALYRKQEKSYSQNSALYAKGIDYSKTHAALRWVLTHKLLIAIAVILVAVGLILAIALPPTLNPVESVEDYFNF